MTAFLLFLILIVLLHIDFMMSRKDKPTETRKHLLVS